MGRARPDRLPFRPFSELRRRSMSNTLKTISPADNRVYVERPLATAGEVARALAVARQAQAGRKHGAVAERVAVVERFVAAFEAKSAGIAEEISWQMGRPIKYSPGEVRGFSARGRSMAGGAPGGRG